MRRLVRLVALSTLLSSSLAASAGGPPAKPENPPPCTTAECLETPDVLWQPKSMNSVSRLPATRVVVYDPVTNSFAFVASVREPCKPSQSCPDVDKNQAMLDRRRLALTTQKIRLLIMPYNPNDGALKIEAIPGTGTEIDESLETAQATTAQTPSAQGAGGTSGKTKTSKAVTPPPDGKLPTPAPPAPTPQAKAGAPKGKKTGAGAATKPGAAKKQPQGTAGSQGQPQPPAVAAEVTNAALHVQQPDFPEVLAQSVGHLPTDPQTSAKLFDVAIDGFDFRAGRVSDGLRAAEQGSGCSLDHVRDLSREISQRFEQQGFQLAADSTFEAIVRAAEERRRIVREVEYTPCFPLAAEAPAGRGGSAHRNSNTFFQPVEADLRELQNQSNEIASDLAQIQGIVAQQGRLVDFVSLVVKQKGATTAAEWAGWIAAATQRVSDEQTFVKDAKSKFDEIDQGLTKPRDEAAAFQAALASPALAIQRFNFSPLRLNSSLTLKITRGKVDKKDQSAADISERVNSLTLLSAPAYRIRFGIGVVGSTLASPNFKAGKDAAGNAVVLKDDSRGDVLPGIFVYHQWGFRSPVLASTAFEKLMPTFSFGLPLTKSDVFHEILVGLNWQLSPGFLFSLGCHLGEVNALAKGSVGGVLTPGTDVSSLQEKRFQTGFYAGIVLNTDTFKGLQTLQQ